MRRLVGFALMVMALGCGGGGTGEEPANLVVMGGRIVTMADAQPEAEALASRGGRLVAIGSQAEIQPFIGRDTEVLELPPGALAVPGLVEAHGHFLSLGRSQLELALAEAASWDEIVAMVAGAASERPAGSWIVGRGWHQEKWAVPAEPAVEGMPVHDALSAAVPDHPVVLTHASGHAVIVNAAAMGMAGIDASTADPPGGEIVRARDGRPTGVLRETAEELVAGLRERDESPERIEEEARLAAEECLAKGVTSFHDAGTTLAQAPVLAAMAESGRLGVRLWVMLSDDTAALEAALPGAIQRRVGDGFFTVGGIKRWVDGALGAHGAWLLEPYTDHPDSTGLNIVTAEELSQAARLALAHDLQLCSHAIGDRANRMTLDVYEEALAGDPRGRERRWRVEHAQHLHPEDIPRFAELGVVASMQPVHCTSDGPWVPQRLGEERTSLGAYRWRDLLDSGAVVVSGSDTPVEDVDPIATFAAAVTRRMANGEAFVPEQAMSREEALRSMTRDAAWAAFEEDVVGTLEVGKYADITVFPADLLTIPAEEIRSYEVLATIVAGEIRYRAE